MTTVDYIARAQTATSESKSLDFKQEFDLSSAEAWCGIIKDIVAIANSGGGIIVVGLLNDGTDSGVDVSSLHSIDSAEVTNKIYKYSGYQFADFEVISVERVSKQYPAILIGAAEIPIVFTKPGTYSVGTNQQKTAFGQGTVYFRHGSKSEPGTRDDLQKWFGMEIKKARKEWLSGIRRVVASKPGRAVSVTPLNGAPESARGFHKVRISYEAGATKVAPLNTEEVWPHRQKDLLALVNSKLPKADQINGHDVLCLNHNLDIIRQKPEFAHKPHKLASAQYSDGYVDWMLKEYSKDNNFFRKARIEHQEKKAK